MTSYEIIHKPKPKINELEHLLKNDPRIHQNLNYKKALELKLQSLIQEPSPIEKTMSEVQLFESNSPFWATDLTIAQIHDVLEAREELIQQGYSEFMEYLLTEVRNPNYDIHYVGQQETALTFYYKLFYSL